MDKDQKKKLKAQFKQNEQNNLITSLPLPIDELKELLTFLNREKAPPCDHTLRESIKFLKDRSLDTEKIIPWLNDHGGYCDCEVIFNVYDDVGDIVGWHLEE